DIRFGGGVQVAVGDVNHDGTPDLITGAGPGGGPHVKVFNGTNFTLLDGPLGSFFAFEPDFRGGVFVAASDINDDNHADIITGAGPGGGSHVKVFSGDDGSLLGSFFAFEMSFTGGVRVAANGKEIIASRGPGSEAEVRVFDTSTFTQTNTSNPFPQYTGGAFVAPASMGVGDTLHAAGEAVTPAGDVAPLTTEQLQPLVTEALARLQAAGVAETEIHRLANLDVAIVDLPQNILGLATEERILIDINAAGYGWFVDSTPDLDEEYAESEGVLRGIDSNATNHIDLLSVLVHEFGHHLGFVDVTDLTNPMGEKLDVGTRRVDFSHDELFANPDALADLLS
ncbi:MAG: FG-GAP repeat protein, partial [Planctomycetaceae bacterium]|nr:FG-GAP repeat protein [Planctomycetaceae bacterium]